MRKPFFDLPYAGTAKRMEWPEVQQGMSWLQDRIFLIRYEDDELPSVDWVLNLARAAVLRHGIRGLIIDPYNELDHQRPRSMTETEYVSQMLTKVSRLLWQLPRRITCSAPCILHHIRGADRSGSLVAARVFDLLKNQRGRALAASAGEALCAAPRVPRVVRCASEANEGLEGGAAQPLRHQRLGAFHQQGGLRRCRPPQPGPRERWGVGAGHQQPSSPAPRCMYYLQGNIISLGTKAVCSGAACLTVVSECLLTPGPLNEAQILVRKVRNKAAGTIGEAALLYDSVSGRFEESGSPQAVVDPTGRLAGPSIDFSAAQSKFEGK